VKVDKQNFRSIALADDGWQVVIIDQTRLPHQFETITLDNVNAAADAISTMQVRGAPLIGATAAYGMALAVRLDSSDEAVKNAQQLLLSTRPTAVNLRWALDALSDSLLHLPVDKRVDAAYQFAAQLCEQDVQCNRAIGQNGMALIERIQTNKPAGQVVNILTHCNAGWLATVDWGTALAPIYAAQSAGIDCHVWVDETRPRNQGSQLTAWELANQGISHQVITDNAGGHLMQSGSVDLCIVGTDRTTTNGDVCNKIGTYLKALAASDNDVPFYVALPGSTIDWQCTDATQIPIELRSQREVTHVVGKDRDGKLREVQLTPDNTRAHNPAFDVTPAKLVTALITERGCCAASREGLLSLFPEHG
jgi:methylthioribose-1-phosphate isomerase